MSNNPQLPVPGTSLYLYHNATPFGFTDVDPEDLRDWFFVAAQVAGPAARRLNIHINDATPVVIDSDAHKQKLVDKYPQHAGAFSSLPTRADIVKGGTPELAGLCLISAEMMTWVIHPDKKIELVLAQRPFKPENPNFPMQGYWNAPAGRMDTTLAGTARGEWNEEVLAIIVGPKGPEILTAQDYHGDLGALRRKQFELNAERITAEGLGDLSSVPSRNLSEDTAIPWEIGNHKRVYVTSGGKDEDGFDVNERLWMTAWFDEAGKTWQLRSSARVDLQPGEQLIIMPGEAKNPQAAAVDPDKFLDSEENVVPTTRVALVAWLGQKAAQAML